MKYQLFCGLGVLLVSCLSTFAQKPIHSNLDLSAHHDCGTIAAFHETDDLLYAGFVSPPLPPFGTETHYVPIRCIDTLIESRSRMIYAVIGGNEEDLYSYFQIHRVPFLPHEIWKKEVQKQPLPRHVAVVLRVEGKLEVRVWNGLSTVRRRMDHILSSHFGTDTFSSLNISDIRHISASFSAAKVESAAPPNTGWTLVGANVYIVSDESSAMGKKLYSEIRRSLVSGELMLFISSAPCFRSVVSFPYLDIMTEESARCLSTPLYGKDLLVCYGEPNGGAVACRER